PAADFIGTGVVDENIDRAKLAQRRLGNPLRPVVAGKITDGDNRFSPVASISCCTRLAAFSFRPCTTMAAPSRAKVFAMPSPMPLLLPVMIARLPVKRKSMYPSFLY